MILATLVKGLKNPPAVNLLDVARECVNFSGADLKALLTNAQLLAVNDHLLASVPPLPVPAISERSIDTAAASLLAAPFTPPGTLNPPVSSLGTVPPLFVYKGCGLGSDAICPVVLGKNECELVAKQVAEMKEIWAGHTATANGNTDSLNKERDGYHVDGYHVLVTMQHLQQALRDTRASVKTVVFFLKKYAICYIIIIIYNNDNNNNNNNNNSCTAIILTFNAYNFNLYILFFVAYFMYKGKGIFFQNLCRISTTTCYYYIPDDP